MSAEDYEKLFVNLEGIDLNEMIMSQKTSSKELQKLKDKTNTHSPNKASATATVSFASGLNKSPQRKTLGTSYYHRLEAALVLCLVPKTGVQYHSAFQVKSYIVG